LGIKLKEGTLVIPYSGNKHANAIYTHLPQTEGTMPFFITMWRQRHKNYDPLIIFHVNENNVVVQGYVYNKMTSEYGTDRFELYRLPTLEKQTEIAKKLFTQS
jgi:hypothetical protein